MKLLTTVTAMVVIATPVYAADPLPSWNDTAPKQAIVSFVEMITKDGSTDFVPPAERIAGFDNDGTLWSEQPMYFQAFSCSPGSRPSPLSIPNGRRRNPSPPSSRAT
jgi:hypothetical protein